MPTLTLTIEVVVMVFKAPPSRRMMWLFFSPQPFLSGFKNIPIHTSNQICPSTRIWTFRQLLKFLATFGFFFLAFLKLLCTFFGDIY